MVQVLTKGDRIILLKLVLEKDFQMISVYDPQVCLSEQVKKKFWEALDKII